MKKAQLFVPHCTRLMEALDVFTAVPRETAGRALGTAVATVSEQVDELDLTAWKVVAVQRMFLQSLGLSLASRISDAREEVKLFPGMDLRIASEVRRLLTPHSKDEGPDHGWFDPGCWRLPRAQVDFERMLRLECLVSLMAAQEQGWTDSGLNLAGACRLVMTGQAGEERSAEV